MISQLTVFLENEKGRLAAACRTLADAGVNLHTLNLADTTEFGIARIICDAPDKAADALQAAGWRAATTQVMAVRVPNKPGGLAQLLEFFDQENVNIEYGYCISLNSEVAVDILKVDDPSVEEKVKAAGYDLVEAKDVYHVD